MMKYEIVSINTLVPLEKVFQSHLINLEDMINNDGFMLKAIIADRKMGVILDGSHRYVYLVMNGYTQAPVCFVDYKDENIRVGKHLCHRFFIDGDSGISKTECINRALKGNLFPPRTTRHFFTFRKNDISVPLSRLNRGVPVDVSGLISKSDISDEITSNEDYIKEINEETELLIDYLSEISQTKKYLTKQIALMKESRLVAFFPGKFHPPHIGHILTILNELPKYKKFIIGVSGDIPRNQVATPGKIADTLKLFFNSFNNVEVMLINGVLTETRYTYDLPKFDVLLSGNEDVLYWAKMKNIEFLFVPRSDGFMCNGTEVRATLFGDNNE